MKTLLVIGKAALPAPLREVAGRGSTSIVEHGAVPASYGRKVFVRPRDEDRLTLAFMTGA